jgi:hypothetical protein
MLCFAWSANAYGDDANSFNNVPATGSRVSKPVGFSVGVFDRANITPPMNASSTATTTAAGMVILDLIIIISFRRLETLPYRTQPPFRRLISGCRCLRNA